jgi:hypothetical protein
MNCAASIAFFRAGAPFRQMGAAARLTAKKEIIEAGIPGRKPI